LTTEEGVPAPIDASFLSPYFRLKEELQLNEGLATIGVNLEIT